MPSGGEIDDRETTMSQPDAAILRPPFPRVIGAAVAHGVTSSGEEDTVGNRDLRSDTYDAAHGRFIHSPAKRCGSEEPKTFSETSALAWPDCRRRVPRRSAPVSLFFAAKYSVRASVHAMRRSNVSVSSIRFSSQLRNAIHSSRLPSTEGSLRPAFRKK